MWTAPAETGLSGGRVSQGLIEVVPGGPLELLLTNSRPISLGLLAGPFRRGLSAQQLHRGGTQIGEESRGKKRTEKTGAAKSAAEAGSQGKWGGKAP